MQPCYHVLFIRIYSLLLLPESMYLQINFLYEAACVILKTKRYMNIFCPFSRIPSIIIANGDESVESVFPCEAGAEDVYWYSWRRAERPSSRTRTGCKHNKRRDHFSDVHVGNSDANVSGAWQNEWNYCKHLFLVGACRCEYKECWCNIALVLDIVIGNPLLFCIRLRVIGNFIEEVLKLSHLLPTVCGWVWMYEEVGVCVGVGLC